MVIWRTKFRIFCLEQLPSLAVLYILTLQSHFILQNGLSMKIRSRIICGTDSNVRSSRVNSSDIMCKARKSDQTTSGQENLHVNTNDVGNKIKQSLCKSQTTQRKEHLECIQCKHGTSNILVEQKKMQINPRDHTIKHYRSKPFHLMTGTVISQPYTITLSLFVVRWIWEDYWKAQFMKVSMCVLLRRNNW